MSDLTSTVPGAFDALYGLLSAVGALQSPQIAVFHTALIVNEPAEYVILRGVENHRFEVAALGSYAQYETFDLTGCVNVLQGDIDPQATMTRAWTIYQTVVMGPVVANRGHGTPPLGAAAPDALEWVIPAYARYTGQPGQFGDGLGGFAGQIEFAFSLKARITAT